MMPAVRPAGDRGALIDLPDSAAAVRLARALTGRPDLVDVVPGHRTVLVTWAGASVRTTSRQLAASALAGGSAARIGAERRDPGGLRRRRSRGGGAPRGPLARGGGRAARRGRYIVAFIGFAPGFAYLVGGDERLAVPRLPRPRERVQAGSVAIAGPYSGVYPRESPGGWRLIGRTSLALFDPQRDLARTALERRPRPVHAAVNEVAVVRAGPLTTVQDRGRPGLAQLGVPPSGAADQRALELGNRIVGNDPGAAALESTLLGPALRFAEPALVAVTGAEADATISGRPLEHGLSVGVPAGGTARAGPLP